jgi:hypothetical protein
VIGAVAGSAVGGLLGVVIACVLATGDPPSAHPTRKLIFLVALRLPAASTARSVMA